MRVQSIVLWRLRLPMKFDFHTAKGVVRERQTLIVEVITESGIHGFGEVVAFETPFYTDETIDISEEWLRNVIPFFVGFTMHEPWDCYNWEPPFEQSGVDDSVRKGRSTRAYVDENIGKNISKNISKNTGKNIGERLDAWERGALALLREGRLPMAWAGLENALLHAFFEEQNKPMIQTLVDLALDKDYALTSTIPLGLVFGDMPIPLLLEKISGAVAQGCKRVKIKLTPNDAEKRLAAVRNRFPDLELAADANRSFAVSQWPLVKALDAYHLKSLEEPFEVSHSVAQTYGMVPKEFWQDWNTPLSFDESVQSLDELKELHGIFKQLHLQNTVIDTSVAASVVGVNTPIDSTTESFETSLDSGALARETAQNVYARPTLLLNIKIGRLGGLREALRCIAYCKEQGIGFWVGSMVESGISKILHVELSALPAVWMAGDLSDSMRYFEADLIEPLITFSKGYMRVPAGPGLGVKVNRHILHTYGTIIMNTSEDSHSIVMI